ncbi:hypothetical protein LIER_20218 [Lithospermum erythrorhizon]|uniref:Integrase catalytic domain-containing protein n=1 Tax=Lithospermum erythrorhizon TaxID=34254 RepID=A0AAV3QMY4_LITER
MVSMLYLVPFYQWAVDIVGDLPRTPGGKMYTIVVVDYFTKWVDAKPLTRQGQDQNTGMASVSYPQANGHVEVMNRVIFKGVKKRLQEEGGYWE